MYQCSLAINIAQYVGNRKFSNECQGATAALFSIPGCVTAGCDREAHEAAHNWLSVIRVRGGVGRPGCPCLIVL
jgi:hypothetical protein